MKQEVFMEPIMRRWTLFLALILAATCNMLVGAEETIKHITVPFKKVKAYPWSEDGTSFQLEILDDKLGALTLTLRIQDVNSGGFTLAADGTDFAMGYPLPAEENAVGLYRFLSNKIDSKKPAGDAEVREPFRILLQAGYFKLADRFLQDASSKPALKEALQSELRTARTEYTFRITRELIQQGIWKKPGATLPIG